MSLRLRERVVCGYSVLILPNFSSLDIGCRPLACKRVREDEVHDEESPCPYLEHEEESADGETVTWKVKKADGTHRVLQVRRNRYPLYDDWLENEDGSKQVTLTDFAVDGLARVELLLEALDDIEEVLRIATYLELNDNDMQRLRDVFFVRLRTSHWHTESVPLELYIDFETSVIDKMLDEAGITVLELNDVDPCDANIGMELTKACPLLKIPDFVRKHHKFFYKTALEERLHNLHRNAQKFVIVAAMELMERELEQFLFSVRVPRASGIQQIYANLPVGNVEDELFRWVHGVARTDPPRPVPLPGLEVIRQSRLALMLTTNVPFVPAVALDTSESGKAFRSEVYHWLFNYVGTRELGNMTFEKWVDTWWQDSENVNELFNIFWHEMPSSPPAEIYKVHVTYPNVMTEMRRTTNSLLHML